MPVLEINPVVGFMANYLCLVLGYLGKFLYYKILTSWFWKNLLKKNYSHSGHCDITRWDPLIRPINNACSDSGHKFELFSITQAQWEQQKKVSTKEKKLSHNYEVDLYR